MLARNSHRQPGPRNRLHPRHRRLQLEQLEDRRVLSAIPLTFSKVFTPDTIGPGSSSGCSSRRSGAAIRPCPKPADDWTVLATMSTAQTAR